MLQKSQINSNQITKEKKQKYQGHLFTLHTELYWHSHQINLLKKSLNLLAETSKNKKDFLLNRPIFLIDIQLTDQILLTLIEFKDYDHNLVVLLTSYSNQIKLLNYALDFENANELMKHINDADKSIESFISKLDKEYLTKTKSTIFKIQTIFQQELSNLPNKETLFDLFFKENAQNNL